MTRTITLSLLMIACLYAREARAQQLIPFDFTSEEENRLIKENDTLKYYAATEDTGAVVCLNEEASYYKLIDRSSRQVIAEGSYLVEGEHFLQQGKWVERYENGKIKNSGYYLRGKPIGTWQENYSSGKPKTITNYTVITNEQTGTKYCMTGSWEEFYTNGKLKTSGHYSAEEGKTKDTIKVEDPITGQKIVKVRTIIEYTPVKAGVWEYYSENGELERREEL